MQEVIESLGIHQSAQPLETSTLQSLEAPSLKAQKPLVNSQTTQLPIQQLIKCRQIQLS
jgi:hypothetical protein